MENDIAGRTARDITTYICPPIDDMTREMIIFAGYAETQKQAGTYKIHIKE